MSWEATKNFANSAFITALLGSLAGAFAGAAAAQRIAERSKHREELLREIRNTNAAIALAFGVCNTLLALKKQHVKSLKESYDAQKAALLEFQRKRKAGEIQQDVAFDFNADNANAPAAGAANGPAASGGIRASIHCAWR
ncbi:MAG: hypothetical protein ACREVF_00660 [Burkholderiales bacterium]